MLHYPGFDTAPTEIRGREIGIGTGAHTDYGCLTLLTQDDVGGLQVFGENGEWIDVCPIKDYLVVNIGDMLMHWTGNDLKSTLHRVLNNPNKSRYSVPFFYEPDWNVKVEPFTAIKERASHVKNKDLPECGPVVYGEYITLKYSNSFSDMADKKES